VARGARRLSGFAEAYFDHRVTMGGFAALRITLNSAVGYEAATKETQAAPYVLAARAREALT